MVSDIQLAHEKSSADAEATPAAAQTSTATERQFDDKLLQDTGDNSALAAAATPAAASPENADDKSLEVTGEKSVSAAAATPEAANTSTATGKQSNKGLPSSAHEAVWRVLEDMLLLKHKF